MPRGDLLKVELVPKEITLGQLAFLHSNFAGLAHEVATEITGQPADAIRWVVERVYEASFGHQLRAEPTDIVPAERIPRITRALVNGFQILEDRPERPPYFNDRALERVKEITSRIGVSLIAFVVSNGDDETVRVSPRALANTCLLIERPEEVFSVGTVEGRLETINIHAQRYFHVYDGLTGERIECRFGEEIDPEQIGPAIGRRVAVFGRLTHLETGELKRVEAQDIEIFPREEELPTADDVLGVLSE